VAAERLSMRKIKEILRLAAEGLSNRAIGKSVGIGHTTVSEYRRRVVAAALSWELCRERTDREWKCGCFHRPLRPAYRDRSRIGPRFTAS